MHLMKRSPFLTVFSLLLIQSVFSQQVINRDAEIEGMLKEVSADSLRSYVNKMVSFGTRHTLSSTTDKKRGIGAARE